MESKSNIFNQGFGSKSYLLMNKDTVWAEFTWSDLDKITLVKENFHLPFKVTFDQFIRRRTPPKHRAFMKELLAQLQLNGDRDVIEFSKGLSLTDTFWIQEKSEGLHWADINLYENPFSEVVSRIAFEGGLFGRKIAITSPEFTTDGMLAKCWVREESTSRISLYKAGTNWGVSNDGREPYSEVLASQLLDRLGYNHVNYSLQKYRRKLVSVCPLITTQSVSMFPIWTYFSSEETLTLQDLFEFYNNHGWLKQFCQVLVFDYLSLNPDRHANNFGILVNANTLEPIGPAPIYDNGASMLNYYSVGQDFSQFKAECLPALYPSFELGAQLAKRYSGVLGVNDLVNFKFNRDAVIGYSADKIDFIEQFIQQRVQEYLAY